MDQNYPTTGEVQYDFHLVNPNQASASNTLVTFGAGANAVVQNPAWVADAGEYIEQIEYSCACQNGTLPGGQAQAYTSAVITSAGTATETSPFNNGNLYFGQTDAQAVDDGSYTFYYQYPVTP